MTWIKRLFCKHEWVLLFAHPVTLQITERYCRKCNQHQRSTIVWENKHDYD